MNIRNLRRDKLFLVLLIVIILLGVFIRFYRYSDIGYWNDDQAHIPAGLMWFYPHEYFPGLNYGNPPLGDIMVGAGCMLSGEDFSGVSQVKPFFYPDRPSFLTNLAKEKVDMFCHLPMYVFGLIFFILVIMFALVFFEKYSAFFFISFFAFYHPLLSFTRVIKPDIVLWVFLLLGIFFLLKAYYESEFRRELRFSLISFLFFGLGLATKFTAGIFLLFAVFILLKKHKSESLSMLNGLCRKLNLTILNKVEIPQHEKRFFKVLVSSLIVFLIIVLIPFKFNPKNFYDTYAIYQQMNKDLGTISISLNSMFEFFKMTLMNFNVIDVLIFLFAIYLFFRLIFSRNKTKLESFTIYLVIIGILTSLFFSVINTPNRGFPFIWGILFLMALSFSKKEYSIFNLFKIRKKKIVFFIFIVIYVLFSFSIALSNAPYFRVKNPVLCHLYDGCEKPVLSGFASKATASYLKSVLKDDETFIGQEGIIFYYLKQKQNFQNWNFDQAFLKQVGRLPTVPEKVKYFNPDNQTVRYLLVFPYEDYEDEFVLDIKDNYEATHKVILNGEVSMLVYDLQKLQKNV